MAPKRVVQLSLKTPTHAVCVVGVEAHVDIHSDVPKGANSFRVSGSSEVDVFMVYNRTRVTEPIGKARWPLDTDADMVVSVGTASKELKDFKKTWRWGPEGYGAILLVNCDRDNHRSAEPDLTHSWLMSLADLQDMSPMLLSCNGPDKLFDSHKLVLNVPFSDSKRVRVFRARGGNSLSDYKQVLGPQCLSYEVERQPGEQEIKFYVEGLTFPDADFLGLVSLSVSLVDPGTLPEVILFTDTVGFRMAPWIMTPNTQPPEELYVCSVMDTHGSNEKFLEDMSYLTLKANCKLTICPQVENRNDRWIQDEMEFGYIEAPHKSFPVVFDSPRNRGLKDFPYKRILGFRMLLASPSACLKLFQEKKEEGYGEAAQFDGLKHQAKRSINEMLADRHLQRDNLHAQKCIDWNRNVLKRELGLAESDIVDIPQLFFLKNFYAEAFFPDMVNMVVLGKYLGIPKPYGPIINGRCCLEEKVQSLLEPLGLHCIFIDDYLSYHELQGEIHCGTNVRRKPFPFKWWNMVP
ncbi:PADI1 isoform 2 [Pan troglodytes]|uniref:PADI1 isoform 2 n=1 Tax=Pan troglodytes TaxID=9598 RepID=A0A2J8KEJ6_PANTR|nr:PADI1 isoform 2 [Pan troglodytes]